MTHSTYAGERVAIKRGVPVVRRRHPQVASRATVTQGAGPVILPPGAVTAEASPTAARLAPAVVAPDVTGVPATSAVPEGTSVDRPAATLGRGFGASDGDLADFFPTLGGFDSTDLDLMHAA